jgi:uncharacterized protein (DUF1501 family)
LMHTGFRMGQQGVAHPVLGSMAAQAAGDRPDDLPAFVSLGASEFNGFGPGHLGAKAAPVRVDNPADGLPDLAPDDSLAGFDRRAGLLAELDRGFGAERPAASVAAHRTTLDRAARLMHSTKTAAFDLSKEPESVRQRYGSSKLAHQFLLARRLVESGVKFVELRQGGWDVHKDTVARTTALSQELDGPLAALLADLKQRGLLNSTLVIAMGEFGRNPANGSNHFGRAWTTLLAGGGLRHGQALGDTGKSGGTVESQPVRPGDFMATVQRALGMPWERDWQVAGRPIDRVAKDAAPVKELFG